VGIACVLEEGLEWKMGEREWHGAVVVGTMVIE